MIDPRGKTAVAGVGYRQYKRGTAPLPERGVLVHTIVDACADAGLDPADVDGFLGGGQGLGASKQLSEGR